MGSNCGFFAFRSAPDVERLLGIEWLAGFTLFKRKDRAQWYMEGPLPEGEGISFYEPLEVYRNKLNPLREPDAKAAVAWLSKTTNEIASSATFDDGALAEGLLISRALDTDVLVVFGNDEELDGALECSHGKLVGGSLHAGGSEVLHIAGERKATIATVAPEDELDMPNSFYRRAIEEAGRFFGEFELAPHWSDYSAEWPDHFELIAKKAAADERAPPPQCSGKNKGLLSYLFKR